jgi:deazaflavin-dependent oxidoreductase (nitroreductase family)
VPRDLGWKALNTIHQGLLRVTGGRIGRTAYGMPVVELTTTGRKTGQPRTVVLTSPVQDGDTIVIVASRGGARDHPSWFLNLRDQPRVEVSFRGGARAPYVARVATPEERAELWPRATAVYKHYDSYQRRTEREIPLVLLDPDPA